MKAAIDMEYSVRPFRDEILDYLRLQKQYEEADLLAHKHLTHEEKVEQGLLIMGAEVIRQKGKEYVLRTFEDNTKMRVGDRVVIVHSNYRTSAKIVDLGVNLIALETSTCLLVGDSVNIEVMEFVLLEPMIQLAQEIEDGRPGASFLRQLAGLEDVVHIGLGSIDPDMVDTIPSSMNKMQREVVCDVLNRPSVFCIQGPPGTGKTAVLATIAHTFASENKEVLVIANTHQAVNNALNKIAKIEDGLNIVKIGELVRAEGLDDSIITAERYNTYIKSRKKPKKRGMIADIVGMTLHAAIVNLGLRKTGFQPSIVLVDEAGQIPMPYASLIGAFGGGSIAFIGDDLQMPPIFHEKLISHPFSKSIFSYLRDVADNIHKSLDVTYRMNNSITDFCSKSFYLSEKINLKSSEYSSGKRLFFDDPDTAAPIHVSSSFVIVDAMKGSDVVYQDENPEEALAAVNLVKEAVRRGLSKKEVAIITPYRRQVKLFNQILSTCKEDFPDGAPLANTVECLQGQDVSLIVISFCASDPEYVRQQLSFLLNPNRLNVMVSRAKMKVVMFMSNPIKEAFFSESLPYGKVLKDQSDYIIL